MVQSTIMITNVAGMKCLYRTISEDFTSIMSLRSPFPTIASAAKYIYKTRGCMHLASDNRYFAW